MPEVGGGGGCGRAGTWVGGMTGNWAEKMTKKSGKTCAVSTAQKATSRFQAMRDYGIRGAGVRLSRTYPNSLYLCAIIQDDASFVCVVMNGDLSRQ